MGSRRTGIRGWEVRRSGVRPGPADGSDRTDVRDAFAERLAGHDMGKGCLRFRKPEQIDFDLVRDLLRATAAEPGKIC